jgi:hypothetical protein
VLAGVRAAAGEESKQFFFEKKNQKTFIGWGVGRTLRQTSKSFLFLFFKKEILPCFLA